MTRSITLMALLAIGLLLADASSAAGQRSHALAWSTSSTAPTTSVTSHGVKLSLQIPSLNYPHSALVPASVRLTNLTSHDISTWQCPRSSLGVQILGNGGKELYPPLLPPPGAPWTDCVGAIATPRVVNVLHVPAGGTVTRYLYFVALSRSVGAMALLRLAGSAGKPITILTPVIHLQLAPAVSATVPRILLRTSPRVQAGIQPVVGGGPIRYSQFASCRATNRSGGRFNASAVYSRWTQTNQRVLQPFRSPCRSVMEWYLFVAQVGYPITHAYYCRRSNLCAYAPPTPQQKGVEACKLDTAHAVSSGRLPRSAVRYAIGLATIPPPGLTPAQLKLAKSFHDRCAPLLKPGRHA